MSKKKEAVEVKLNIDEVKNFMSHIISNNRYLQKQGKPPVSVAIEGESGIGKTSTMIQLAEEEGLSYVKLNLAQIEELGDLVGFPILQFEMKNGNESIWVDEHGVEDYKKMGYTATHGNRMSYCPPEWISGKKNGGILLLDDWNRADVRFIQAVMELIDRQQYISWKLPQDWHIVLTSNPDNGEYLVNSIDNAQKTRFIKVNLKFDVDCWARWAENEGMDGRCINFLLMHPEMINNKVNARSAVMFFNSISSLSSFEKSLGLIQTIGEGSVGMEFSTMFSTFINNKLDRLPSPKDIMFDDEKQVLNNLKNLIGKGNSYRADIASTIATRIINYSIMYSQDNNIPNTYITRLEKLITGDIFASDLRYSIVKNIFVGNVKKFSVMTQNSKLVEYTLK